MTDTSRFVQRPAAPVWTRIFVCLLAVAMIALAGCGSTKVYTADKTITYNGSIYNMGNVQQVSGRVEGQLPDGSTVNMKTLDKKGVEALLKENGEVVVSTTVGMDDKDMVYQRARVKKYSEYDKMVDRFDDAMSDISKFMADKKKTQLKLK
jgi:hypothetical protein